MLGNYVLSSSQYDGLYLKALKLRHSLGSHFSQIYQNVDCIISPTTPTPAWKIGTNNNDPLSVYLSDIYTITANLIGAPALSMPLGRHRSS
jgi:aspartyl-tRNA(Asn)/glutamyl-tRNA(Gln) amidotransferase subunit A